MLNDTPENHKSAQIKSLKGILWSLEVILLSCPEALDPVHSIDLAVEASLHTTL